ncbi:MAG: HEAT repeat domain-containing protein [Planctomycetes bacterium]|nr:HEAT repeat domain-containing protein [Planctomycetota bacterium]
MPTLRAAVRALAAFLLVLPALAAGGAPPQPEDREAVLPPDPLKRKIEPRALKRLLAELKDIGKPLDGEGGRLEIAGLFAYFRETRAVPTLVEIVQSPREPMALKTACLWVLGEIGSPLAMPAFQYALMRIYDGKDSAWTQAEMTTVEAGGKEKTISLREMCEARLGRLAEAVLLKQHADDPPRLVDVLLEPLVKGVTPDKPPDEGDKREYDWGRLRAALISVAAVGDRSPTAVKALADVVRADDNYYPWDFKVIAAEALSTILVRRFHELKGLKAKDKISDEIAGALIQAFGVTDIPEVREVGGRALREAGRADRAAKALVSVLKALPGSQPGAPPDPTRRVRYRCIEALACLESKDAAEYLAFLMFDPDRNARWRAAVALGMCGDERAAKLLRTLLKDSDPVVRLKAVMALSRLGAFDALADLVVAMEDPDYRVRRQAAAGLGRLGLRQAIPVLTERGLKDKSAWVRAVSVVALGQIKKGEGMKAVPPMLADQDPGVRRTAVQVLGKFLNPAATSALVKALADPDEGVRADAGRAVAERLQSSPREVLPQLADAIAGSKGPARLAAVQCVDADYRKARPAQGQDPKRRALYDRLLDGLNAPLASGLHAALADENPKVRAAAGKLLMDHAWAVKSKELMTPVAALGADLDREVRNIGVLAQNYLRTLR